MVSRLGDILKEAKKEKRPYQMMLLLGGTNDMGERDPDKVTKNLLSMHQMAADEGILTFAMAIPRHRASKIISSFFPAVHKWAKS